MFARPRIIEGIELEAVFAVALSLTPFGVDASVVEIIPPVAVVLDGQVKIFHVESDIHAFGGSCAQRCKYIALVAPIEDMPRRIFGNTGT